MPRTAIRLGSKPAALAALHLSRIHGWDINEVVTPPDQADWIPRPTLCEAPTSLGIRTVEKQADLKAEIVDFVISYMFRVKIQPQTLSKGNTLRRIGRTK